MTVDPDMDADDEGAGSFSWSVQERRHIAQSFKQRCLASLPLRFSRECSARSVRCIAVTHEQASAASWCRRSHASWRRKSPPTSNAASPHRHLTAMSRARCRYIDSSSDKTLLPVTTYMCEDTAQLLTAERMRSYIPIGDQVAAACRVL